MALYNPTKKAGQPPPRLQLCHFHSSAMPSGKCHFQQQLPICRASGLPPARRGGIAALRYSVLCTTQQSDKIFRVYCACAS